MSRCNMARIGEMSGLITITFVSGIPASFAGTTAFAQAGSIGGTVGNTVPLNLSGIWIGSGYFCTDSKRFLTFVYFVQRRIDLSARHASQSLRRLDSHLLG